MNEIIYNKLCESGLSRIEQWMDIHDIACISASRSYENCFKKAHGFSCGMN